MADDPVGDVAVAWVHTDEVSYSFFESFDDARMHDLLLGGARIGRRLTRRAASGGLVSARNRVVEEFLKGEHDWLWWIDTDMGFLPNALEALLSLADPAERPVVGGLCFAQMERDYDGYGGYVTEPIPTLYRWATVEDGTQGFVSMRDYPRDALVECHATGSAFVLIHRSAFEKVAAKFGDGTWYDQIPAPDGRGLLGEDLSFCVRLRGAGVPVFVHTGIRTTHHKPMWLGEQHYRHPEEVVS